MGASARALRVLQATLLASTVLAGCISDLGFDENDENDESDESDGSDERASDSPPTDSKPAVDEPVGETDRPWGLTASTNREDAVRLRWKAPLELEPDGYLVFRDGALIAELDRPDLSYDDEKAVAGEVSALELSASEGTTTEGIELRWKPPMLERGSRHTYEVRARLGERLSPFSAPATGARAKPKILGFEICAEPCDSFRDAGGAAATSFLDTTAPPCTIFAGAAVAEAHRLPEGAVRLHAPDAVLQAPEPQRYRARALTALGGGPESNTAEGVRGTGVLKLQWQRSTSEHAGSFEDVPNVTGYSWLDASAPLDTELFYRARVYADCATATETETARARTVARAETFFTGGGGGCAIDEAGKLDCWGAEAITAPPPGAFDEASVGYDYACALARGDGHMVCWGSGAPQPDPGVAYIALSTSYWGVCAVREADGGIDCLRQQVMWAGTPTPPPTGTAYVDVAVYGEWSCGLRADDGTLSCSGPLVPPEGRFAQIETTVTQLRHCALREDGFGECWGPAPPGAPSPEPLHALSPEPLRSLASGGPCGLAQSDGSLVCWGGVPALDASTGAACADGLCTEVGITGTSQVCMLTAEGRLRCLSNLPGATSPSLPPSDRYEEALADFALDDQGAIVCMNGLACPELPKGTGYSHLVASRTSSSPAHDGCVLDVEGFPRCFGLPEGRKKPPKAKLRALSAYYGEYCGIRSDDGAITCFGDDENAIDGVEAWSRGLDLQTFARGNAHVCGLDGDGVMHCLDRSPSENVRPAASDQAYIAFGAANRVTCAIEADTLALACWGYFYPFGPVVPVVRSVRYLEVGVGSEQVCALREEDHRISCWPNTGLEADTTHAAYSSLRVGEGYACALRESDGKRVCWGRGFVPGVVLP